MENRALYDYTQHGDFQQWYDTTLKRYYWTLGYASNITVVEIYEAAKKFAEKTGCSLESVQFDEILSSRRYKHFKFIFSQEERPLIEDPKIHTSENVYQWLRD